LWKQLKFLRNSSEAETVVGSIASALRRDISFGELPPDKRLKMEKLLQLKHLSIVLFK